MRWSSCSRSMRSSTWAWRPCGPSAAAQISAQLVDANHVARGVAEGTIANAVWLLGRLLNDLGAAGPQLLEGAVEVLGGQRDDCVGALGHHLDDGAALVVGDTGVGARRVQDDGHARLVGGADREPAHPAVSNVVADLKAEGVAIEGQGGVRIVLREEARLNGDVHIGHARRGSVTCPARQCNGSRQPAIRPGLGHGITTPPSAVRCAPVMNPASVTSACTARALPPRAAMSCTTAAAAALLHR